jgi:hypothetical protein
MSRALLILILLFTCGCVPSRRSEPILSTLPPVIITPTRFLPSWKNPIHLKYGEKVILNDGFQITFSDVIEDTRCIKIESNCSQDGNVKIRLIIQYSPGMESEFLLNTYPKYTSGWINGHVIELEEIKPDLPVTSPSEITNYEIWIMVLLI